MLHTEGLMSDVLFSVVDGCVLLDTNVLYVTETATVHILWIIFGHSATCDEIPYLCGTKGVSTNVQCLRWTSHCVIM